MQFGLLKDSSTTHALVELVHRWQNALDKPGRMVRVLMLNFSSAFDRVDHTIVLEKLANLGTPDFIVKWMTSFPWQRKQRVGIRQYVSDWRTINAGVPQETLCDPVCFLLHINDLHTCFPTLKYVDDSSVWESCASDCHDSHLQEAAEQAETWSSRNLMKINADKTKTMNIDFSLNQRDPPAVVLKMAPQQNRPTCTFKLLGVILSDDLSWGPRVEYLHSKCSQRLYLLTLLKRAGVSNHDILKIYLAMIQYILEYACPVWHSSLTKTQTDWLESIQRRVTQLLHPDQLYEQSPSTLGIPTLQRREELSKTFFTRMMDPSHRLHYLLPKKKTMEQSLRKPKTYPGARCRTERYKNSFIP